MGERGLRERGAAAIRGVTRGLDGQREDRYCSLQFCITRTSIANSNANANCIACGVLECSIDWSVSVFAVVLRVRRAHGAHGLRSAGDLRVGDAAAVRPHVRDVPAAARERRPAAHLARAPDRVRAQPPAARAALRRLLAQHQPLGTGRARQRQRLALPRRSRTLQQ